MNYYEHHLGDYAAATAHLTWDEDMAYTRLLRAYYHHERGIPEGQAYRIARASTPAQRKAVDAVLAEFFVLADGMHSQRRADAEIAKYQDKQRKAKASANARWSQSERNANASPDAMRTHSEGNALQTPDTRQLANASSARAQVGQALKRAGMDLLRVNLADPRLAALLEQGAGPDEFEGIARQAVERGKGWAWVLAALAGQRADAAALVLAPKPAAQVVNGVRGADETRRMLDAQSAAPAADPEQRRAALALARQAIKVMP